MERILVTGCSGFIGFNLCKTILEDKKYEIVGIDNLNNYYDPSLKISRLEILKEYETFSFKKVDIENEKKVYQLFKEFRPQKVVNLAAQAGVRYSIEKPKKFIESNIKGFLNILECCRKFKIEGLIYASSSSVYGGNRKTPFSITDRVDNPISIYAATKISNELMSHVYNHLYGLSTTGLRFFTVYGPWGRPDMAIFNFTKKIIAGEPIHIYNKGNMQRDFTYIDDIVNGIILSLEKNYNCETFNLGNGNPVNLLDMIDLLDDLLEVKSIREFKKMQMGDVEETHADIAHSTKLLGYQPKVSLKEGLTKFIRWYSDYY